MKLEFDEHAINKRINVLDKQFSNKANAKKIINSIWGINAPK
jgi:hypothetical protein